MSSMSGAAWLAALIAWLAVLMMLAVIDLGLMGIVPIFVLDLWNMSVFGLGGLLLPAARD